jgi:hypothetical protein
MLRRAISSGRFIVLVLGTLMASFALLFHAAVVIATDVVDTAWQGAASPKNSKRLAVGLIEVLDAFLIAIALCINISTIGPANRLVARIPGAADTSNQCFQQNECLQQPMPNTT